MTPLDLLLKVRRIHPTILEPAAATFSMWVEKVRSLETSTPKSLRWSFSSIVFPSELWKASSHMKGVQKNLCPEKKLMEVLALNVSMHANQLT